MVAKKVDALKEKLEAEVGSLKATIDERFNIVPQQFSSIQQQFSSLEAMLLKLKELHHKPPPAASRGHGDVVGEGSGVTKPVVGDGAEIGVTRLSDSGAFGGKVQPGQAEFGPKQGGFRSEHVGFEGDRLGGGISGEKNERLWPKYGRARESSPLW